MSDDDERLMAQLERAMAATADVGEQHRRAARGAFAWRTIDSELMALTHDSLVGTETAVRTASLAEARIVSFEGRELRLELELQDGQLTAQVLPPQTCLITLQIPSGDHDRVTVDDSGFFELANVPGGPLRFRIEVGDQVLTSPWLSA